MGRQQYWYTVIPIEQAKEGSDRWAMERNYVSFTPLRIDLTDQDKLSEVHSRLVVSAVKK